MILHGYIIIGQDSTHDLSLSNPLSKDWKLNFIHQHLCTALIMQNNEELIIHPSMKEL